MTLKNDRLLKPFFSLYSILPALILGFLVMLFSGCYSFKDVSIPPEVKTVRVNLIQNKAQYVNPQLSPLLTDRLRQKINNQTRLTLIAAEDAHYDITCVIRNYQVTTAGISDQQAATNRLIVGVHIIFKNRLNDKANFEGDVSRNFDFNAGLSLQAAEAQLSETIVQNLTDEIFNRIFSNW
jgi:hypothetical protein